MSAKRALRDRPAVGSRSFDGNHVRTNGTRSPARTEKRATCDMPFGSRSTGVRTVIPSGPPIASSVSSSSRRTHGIDRAVVEADRQLGAHLDAALEPFDDAHDVGRLLARRHEVDHAHAARRGLPLALEHERVRRGSSARSRARPRRARSASGRCSGVPSSAPKQERRVESREAEPVDRARSDRRAPRSAGRRRCRSPRSAPRRYRFSISSAYSGSRLATARLKSRRYGSGSSSVCA